MWKFDPPFRFGPAPSPHGCHSTVNRLPWVVLLALKIDFDEANLSVIADKDQEVTIHYKGRKFRRASHACAKAKSGALCLSFAYCAEFPCRGPQVDRLHGSAGPT